MRRPYFAMEAASLRSTTVTTLRASESRKRTFTTLRMSRREIFNCWGSKYRSMPNSNDGELGASRPACVPPRVPPPSAARFALASVNTMESPVTPGTRASKTISSVTLFSLNATTSPASGLPNALNLLTVFSAVSSMSAPIWISFAAEGAFR